MMSLASLTTRLVGVRYAAPMTLDELFAFASDTRDLVDRAPTNVVFCCDWRAIDGLSATFADTILRTMRRDNPKVEKNGIVVDDASLGFFVQVERILSEAVNPGRRVFRHRWEVEAFLHPSLTRDEQQRLDAFLDEGTSPAKRAASRSQPPGSVR